MVLIKRISAVLSLAAIAGCATTPVSSTTAPLVPSDRVFAKHLTDPANGSSVIIVMRDTGLMGSACKSRVAIDGTLVADLSPGERVVAYVVDGEHIVGASPVGICGGDIVEVEVVTKPGQQKALRINSGHGGEFRINATAY